MYSARSKGSRVYSLPSVQVVGSGCITSSQQVALQPKKQEKGQEKGVPGGLISWGPADGGWGAFRGKVVVQATRVPLMPTQADTPSISHMCITKDRPCMGRRPSHTRSP